MPTLDNAAAPAADRQPKRVVLRLRVDDKESWRQPDFNDAIEVYLTFAGVPDSFPEHAAHVEPFQDPSLPQKYFHITLDMFKDSIVSPDMNTLPHEVYSVPRNPNGKLSV